MPLTKTPEQPTTEKAVEDVVVAAKKNETVAEQKKTANKKGPKIGFGSHIPRPIRRKTRSFTRLEALVTPKNRTGTSILPTIRLNRTGKTLWEVNQPV